MSIGDGAHGDSSQFCLCLEESDLFHMMDDRGVLFGLCWCLTGVKLFLFTVSAGKCKLLAVKCPVAGEADRCRLSKHNDVLPNVFFCIKSSFKILGSLVLYIS